MLGKSFFHIRDLLDREFAEDITSKRPRLPSPMRPHEVLRR